MVDDWVARAEMRLADEPDRIDAGLARDGLALFRELARNASSEVLLVTDLHAGNVLSSERMPWLIIDPKPYVGDPHYDVVQHLLNCDGSLRASGCQQELLSSPASSPHESGNGCSPDASSRASATIHRGQVSTSYSRDWAAPQPTHGLSSVMCPSGWMLTSPPVDPPHRP